MKEYETEIWRKYNRYKKYLFIKRFTFINGYAKSRNREKQEQRISETHPNAKG